MLYHETDLTPQHHFVDTGGYQDTLWGACHLLGFSLEPRIRDIGDMRLFRMHRKVEEYPNIQVLFPEAINTRAIRENWDHILRLIASIHSGIVPASQILSKLDAYHPESGIFKALRETKGAHREVKGAHRETAGTGCQTALISRGTSFQSG